MTKPKAGVWHKEMYLERIAHLEQKYVKDCNIWLKSEQALITELRTAREQIDIMHKGGMACCPVCKTLVKLRERHLCYQEVK